MLKKALLGCGIVGAAWWVGMDIVGSLRYPGYSYVDQTISELSAQGAPTRTFMLVLSSIPYTVLMTAFGVGIWLAAGGGRAGRIAGALVVAEAVWGFVGGIAFPMATRDVIAAGQDTLRNQMHLWYGIGMPILFALAIGFGSRLLDKRFRYYSYATLLTMLVFGLLMSLQSSAMTANEPTPWLGVQERVTAYAPMLWFMVLATGLVRRERPVAPRPLGRPAAAPRMLPR
jgi:hypothetical protein